MKHGIFLLLFIFTQVLLVAQSPAKIKKLGDQLFDIKEYKNALSKYEQVKDKYVKDIDLKYKIGVCYFHQNDMEQSILYLDFYAKNSKKLEPLTNYYIARAYHLQKKFREAAKYYKNHLRDLSSNDPTREDFKRIIVQCTNGPM